MATSRPAGRVGGAHLVAHPVRRPPSLYDLDVVLAADGGLARPNQIDISLSAADLVELVRRAGAEDCDIRILVAPGNQNLPTLRAVARQLGRDLLVAPTGSELVRFPSAPLPSAHAAADSRVRGEVPTEMVAGVAVMPIDPSSGRPADWMIVQPDGENGSAFGWFELVGGLVLPRTGLVCLPLEGGRALATRETFVRVRADAAALRPGHPDLVTVCVGVRSGDFVLGSYDERTILTDGPGLAAALSSLPLYLANLRLWLSWPDSESERRRLRTNLGQLAEVTGATVWAPGCPGGVGILAGCLDLAALDPNGGPSTWHSYGPPGPFESDVDGRLVPAGGVQVTSGPEVRLASGHLAQEQDLAARGTPFGSSAFTCGLAVLADGRLAVRYSDGRLLAVGQRQFARLLHAAGWDGGDVLLVGSISPEQAPGARRHIADLEAHLGAPITLGQPPWTIESSTVVAKPTGRLLGKGGPDVLPDRLSGTTQESGRGFQSGGSFQADSESTPFDRYDPLVGPGGRSRFLDGPRLRVAEPTPDHRLSWLPALPQTNAEDFDLFVACGDDPAEALANGVPSPALFLPGHLDGDRLAANATAAHLLQVQVSPGGAVDLEATDVEPPGEFAALFESKDVYVLPAGWMPRCRVVAIHRITSSQRLVRTSLLDGVPLLVAPAGAEHGVAGLPAEAVRWPHGWLRRGVSRYLLVSQSSGLGRWQRLYDRRPDPEPHHWLLKVRVGRGQAIDVAATADSLATMSAVRSAAPQLIADGVDYLIPAGSYATVEISGAWVSHAGGWRDNGLRRRLRLDDWIGGQF